MFRTAARFGGLLLGLLPATGAPAQTRDLVLATTTSTQDSGLLDSLLPAFSAGSGIEVKVIAVGSGAALEMARTGDADAVLVHAPEAERGYVQSGDLVEGRRIMHNDFLIVGPANDPVRAAGANGLIQALRRIAAGGAFISRGDTCRTADRASRSRHRHGTRDERAAVHQRMQAHHRGSLPACCAQRSSSGWHCSGGRTSRRRTTARCRSGSTASSSTWIAT
jgi:ABC-type tungstate transport system permease subunit